jgi:hypothetical protein
MAVVLKVRVTQPTFRAELEWFSKILIVVVHRPLPYTQDRLSCMPSATSTLSLKFERGDLYVSWDPLAKNLLPSWRSDSRQRSWYGWIGSECFLEYR